MDTVVLAVSTRGQNVESVHRGSVAVVNQRGDLLYSAGDPDFLTFTRSTIKPFQAAPFVAADGPSAMGFTEREIALMCASHSGEPMHVQAVREMLGKIGCGEQHLHCGCHPPLHFAALELPVPSQAQFSQLHNNCSGKHAGFLAWCVMHEAPTDSYLNPDHPVQKAVRHSLSHFTGLSQQALKQGIDGCSAPNYAIPLWRLAYAYARLACGVVDAEFGDTLGVLFHAMTAHPEFVSGAGRSDLAMMQCAPGDWVAKVGAEGVQAIGIRSMGIGIAIKVESGDGRAAQCIAVEVLRQLGLLKSPQSSPLAAWSRPQFRNLRGIVTGEIQPRFKLAGV
jgi:L-asparaginase II